MKILVFGSGGQLGHCLLDEFSKSKYEVIFCYRTDVDIVDFVGTKTLITEVSPNVVINAAAYTQVVRAERDQELTDKVNHLAVANIAKACESIDALLVHISTDYVFDGKALSPYRENDTPNPLSAYGISKLLGERAISSSGCRYITIRSSWLFSEHGENFMKRILHNATSQQTLRVVSSETGCPTYAPDLARAIVLCLDNLKDCHSPTGLYHFSGRETSTWYDFAALIIEAASDYYSYQFDNISLLQEPEKTVQVVRPKYSALNCQKFVEHFGGVHSDWKAGIIKTLDRLQNC